MNFAEAKAAHDRALTAEQLAQKDLDAAKEAKNQALINASRAGAKPDDPAIVSATTALETASTRLEMAALALADAAHHMHEVEIRELADRAAALVAAHSAATDAAKAASQKARDALQAAQDAVESWRGARYAVAAAAREGTQHDMFIEARAASNPILMGIPNPERPRTRLQTQGSGSSQSFDVALLAPTGLRLRVADVFN